MPRPPALPPLSPTQVVDLQDALLANANRLLTSAITVLEAGDVALARSLAILGLEESAKAIALHERRMTIVHEPEGTPFVDKELGALWGHHGKKLRTVHTFLVNEAYWFGTERSDPEANALALGTIDDWATDHNHFKQRGFYVDVTPEGAPVTPQESADPKAVRAVVERVHQVGWQLRLGEHIEGKRQQERARGVAPADEGAVASMEQMTRRLPADLQARIVADMRRGTPGKPLRNAGYAFALPSNPFVNLGRPGYEAQDRELSALLRRGERYDEPN